MGIFSGIEILFFFLGAMTVLGIQGLLYLRRDYLIRCPAMIVGLIGVMLILFTIAWSVSSVLEGEPQAANMGLVIIGIPGLLILGIFRKMIQKKEQLEETA